MRLLCVGGSYDGLIVEAVPQRELHLVKRIPLAESVPKFSSLEALASSIIEREIYLLTELHFQDEDSILFWRIYELTPRAAWQQLLVSYKKNTA